MGTASSSTGPAFCSPGSPAQSCADHTPLCGFWDLECCALPSSYGPRLLSLEPSQTPDHRRLPHHPQRPQDSSLHLSCLDTQFCLLPMKLALGRSEVALSQDQAQGWGPEGQWGREALTCC